MSLSRGPVAMASSFASIAQLVEVAKLPLFIALVSCSVEVRCSRGRGSPTTTTPAPPPLPGPVDLTLTLDRNASQWPPTPDQQPFSVTRNTTSKGEGGWYSAQSTCSSGQAGTHVLAPYHLYEFGWKVDELPLSRLILPGVLVDVSNEATHNSSFVLTKEHLIAWEKKYGSFPRNSLLLVKYGSAWVGRMKSTSTASTSTSEANLGNGTTPSAVFPGMSRDAAAHLVSQGLVVGVGADVPSLDNHGAARVPQALPVTRTLLAGNLYVLLNVNLNKPELTVKGFTVLVMPAKIRGAAVAGVRVVATQLLTPQSRSGANGVAASLCLPLVSAFITFLFAHASTSPTWP